MARLSSLQRLLSTTTGTLHLRHYSAKPVDRQRHIWISGLVNPDKVGVRARKMLYAGKIDETHRIRFSKQEETQRHHYTQVTALYGVMFIKRNVEKFGDFGTRLRHYPKASELYNGAAITSFNWKKDYQMNIIDTRSPCVDFPDDVRTALSAVDGAVLVLSSVVGVKKHSIIVDREMVRNKFPRLVFINKVDEKGADPWDVLDQTRYQLKHHSAAIQVPIGLEDDFKGLVDLVQLKAYYFLGYSNGKMVVIEDVPANMKALVSEKRRELIETVSKVDGKLAETFRSDKPISSANLEEAVRRATIAKKFIPVFMGSAYKYKGLQLLLDGVLNYLPCPIEASNYNFDLFMKPKYVLDLYTKKKNPLDQSKNGEKHILVALAFTLKKYGQMTYLRIFEGVLRKGDFITDIDTGKKFEVHGLLGLYNNEVVLEAHAGEIIGVIHAGSDNFNLGLARYTTTSINVSKSFSRDSGVQAEFLPFGLYKPRDIRRVRNFIGWQK